MSGGFREISKACYMLASNLKEIFSKIIKAYNDELQLENEIINQYPNSRIKHLALHAKKARVRKKNRQRILNEYYKKLEVKENPTVPQEVLDKLKAEAEAEAARKSAKELEDKTAEAAELLKSAQAEKDAAERERQKAVERAEQLEKQLRMQNPEATEFKRLFQQVQSDIINMENALNKLKDSDPDLAQKFGRAVQDLYHSKIKE